KILPNSHTGLVNFLDYLNQGPPRWLRTRAVSGQYSSIGFWPVVSARSLHQVTSGSSWPCSCSYISPYYGCSPPPLGKEYLEFRWYSLAEPQYGCIRQLSERFYWAWLSPC